MKSLKTIAWALCLALMATPALAQSLTSNPTPAQVLAALGLDNTSRKTDVGYVLCFEDQVQKKLGILRQPKLVALFGALESLGFTLDDLFNTTVCDIEDPQPLLYIFNMSLNNAYGRLSATLVPALADYATQAGKDDAWLRTILFVKNKRGLSIYDDYAAYRAVAISNVLDNERGYRVGLAKFTPHYLKLFGATGLDGVEDLPYFGAYYGIRDPDNFIEKCIGSFGGDQRRAVWVRNAALFERGQFTPRGMFGGADLADIQACLKEPDMEAKMTAIKPAFIARENAREHKEKVASSMRVMEELKADQPKLCPPGVAVTATHPYCSQDYTAIMTRLELITDNARSGLSVADLDRVP